MIAINKDSTMSKLNAKGSYYTEYTRDIFNIMLSIKLSQLPVECHVINDEGVKEEASERYQQLKKERRKTK